MKKLIKKTGKRALPVLLALIMALSLLPLTAFAADQAVISMTVQVNEYGLLFFDDELVVSAGISEAYGFTDAFNGTKVSMLDALVTAHVAIYGSAFEANPGTYLVVGAGGFVSRAFGVNSASNSQMQNYTMPTDTASYVEINHNDFIQFFFYTSSYWYDYETLESVLDYLKTTFSSPGAGNEWVILALARGGYADTAYYDGYYASVLAEITGGDMFSDSTDYSRLTLALTALGVDASDVFGRDITSPLTDVGWVTAQSVNSPIFALLALSSGRYGNQAVVDALIEYILDAQEDDGGWGWGFGWGSDVELTAMALQALAPYYSVDQAVEIAAGNALAWLKMQQDESTGGFIGWGDGMSTCSTAQVVTALSALGEDAAGSDWTVGTGKNPLTALLTWFDDTEGWFGEDSATLNAMATEQAAYALAAYVRYALGMNALYDMSDAVKLVSDNVVPAVTDKTALMDAIATAEVLAAGDYTAASWSILTTALNNARAVANNTNATQSAVDNAADMLAQAIANLSLQGSTPLGYIRISVTDPGATGGQTRVYYTLTRLEMNNNETVFSALLRTGLNIVTAPSSQYTGVYVKSINGFGEFSDGPQSGWMYRVNGVFVYTAPSMEVLRNGDLVEWLFTRDLGLDIGAEILSDETNNTEFTDEKTPLSEFEDWVNPFTDVSETDWFFEAVRFANMIGLVDGVTEDTFSPDTLLTRAMIVTLLYNIDSNPDITGRRPADGDRETTVMFTDVPEGRYYTEAVAWAKANKIVEGYGDGRFGPDDDITREQFAVILMRYAALIGADESPTASLDQYTDAGQISSFALPAMQWAKATGLINGRTTTTLAPQGIATRAEAAVLLMRFIDYLG